MQQLFNNLNQQKCLKVLQEKTAQLSNKDFIFVQGEDQQEYVIRVFNLQSDHDQSQICSEKLNQAQSQAKMIENCSHENIPKYYSSFVLDQFYIMLLESFDSNLYSWSQSVQHFYNIEREAFIKISKELISVVEYIHSKGYFLGKTCLQNIFINKDLKVKVICFGEAQQITPSTETQSFLAQQSGREQLYLPPEYFDYSENHDCKNEKVQWTNSADIWMIGICLYALAGADLFHIQQFTQAKDLFQFNLNKIDFDLRKFVMNILFLNPEQRPILSQLINQLQIIEVNNSDERILQKKLNQSMNQELIILIQEGNKHLHNKQYNEALQVFMEVVKKNSEDYEILDKIAQIYIFQNQFELAKDVLNQSLELNPQNALPHKLLGDIMIQTSQDQSAIIKYFENSIKNYPYYGELDYILGQILCNQEDQQAEDSLYYYQNFSKKYPYSNLGVKQIGIIYGLQKKYQKEINQYDKAYIINPFDYECLILKSQAQIKLLKYTEAKETLDFVLSINPQSAQANFLRGEIDTDDINKPFQFLRKVAQGNPFYPKALYEIAIRLYQNCKYTQSIQYMKKVLKSMPTYSRNYFQLAYAYRNYQNKPEKAVKVFNKVKKMVPYDQFLEEQIKYSKMEI